MILHWRKEWVQCDEQTNVPLGESGGSLNLTALPLTETSFSSLIESCNECCIDSDQIQHASIIYT